MATYEYAPLEAGEPELVIKRIVMPQLALVLPGIVLSLLALAGIAFLATTDETIRVLAVAGCAGVLVALVGAYGLRARLSGLTLRGGRLATRGLLGERTVNPDRPIAKLIDATYDYGWVGGDHGVRVLLVVDIDDRVVLRLAPSQWRADDIERLSTALGVPFLHLRRRMTAARLRRVYPGALPWAMAHPGTAMLMAVVVAFVLWATMQPTVWTI